VLALCGPIIGHRVRWHGRPVIAALRLAARRRISKILERLAVGMAKMAGEPAKMAVGPRANQNSDKEPGIAEMTCYESDYEEIGRPHRPRRVENRGIVSDRIHGKPVRRNDTGVKMKRHTPRRLMFIGEHGWTTEELGRDFELIGFAEPFVVVVKRKSDGVKGTLEFTHRPRVYFGWQTQTR
jgi:hypothetical protein